MLRWTCWKRWARRRLPRRTRPALVASAQPTRFSTESGFFGKDTLANGARMFLEPYLAQVRRLLAAPGGYRPSAREGRPSTRGGAEAVRGGHPAFAVVSQR